MQIIAIAKQHSYFFSLLITDNELINESKGQNDHDKTDKKSINRMDSR